jgi:hypothetical protein
MVSLSREEAEMLVRVVEAILDFAKGFPLEFYSYCPMKRWEPVLKKAGDGIALIESQLSSTAQQIMIPSDVIFAVMDLEECVSGARDARLSSAKTALIISAAGAIGETVLGLSWLGIPAYIISLAIVLGKPLAEMTKDIPAEPFKVSTSISGCKSPGLGDHTDKAKVIERVIVTPSAEVSRYHWGSIRPGRSGIFGSSCLSKGKFRVRIEGWMDDRVEVNPDWRRVSMSMCISARNEIAVWESCGTEPRDTGFPPVPMDSGHEKTIWVEYIGPLTGGVCRKAGPFG